MTHALAAWWLLCWRRGFRSVWTLTQSFTTRGQSSSKNLSWLKPPLVVCDCWDIGDEESMFGTSFIHLGVNDWLQHVIYSTYTLNRMIVLQGQINTFSSMRASPQNCLMVHFWAGIISFHVNLYITAVCNRSCFCTGHRSVHPLAFKFLI